MTNENEFRLLVVADLHYASIDQPAPPARRIGMGVELLRRAIDDASFRGGFDAIALPGDLVNDGAAVCAEGDLAEIQAALAKAAPGLPVLCVPGNHDGPKERLLSLFGGGEYTGEAGPGGGARGTGGSDGNRETGGGECTRELGGCRFVVFADPYAAGDVCTRRESDRRRLLDEASRPGGPIVVLQHNPMNPALPDAGYPYMLTNRPEVLADYSRYGVLLSLSGHYHPGQPLSESGGARYFTAPALCERPFQYTVVSLRGREVRVEVRRLVPEVEAGLVDVHAHTELAYCADGVSARQSVERAGTFGLECICLTEHAPQLYCTAEDFWSGRHIAQPALWRRGDAGRMRQFRDLVGPLRRAVSPAGARPGVLAGLEVELDGDGELTVRPEDADWADILVGAVHFLTRPAAEMSEGQLIEEFMRMTLGLLQRGVDVLAHPWRLLDRQIGRRPEQYPLLVEHLAATRTAAEMNFHKTTNDPAFYLLCVERGVPIALGSDAHEPHEVGNFGAHLALIQEVAGGRSLQDVLWRPGKER